ncbi:hypothetical protein Tco_0835865 [Tanacetum coccineum]
MEITLGSHGCSSSIKRMNAPRFYIQFSELIKVKIVNEVLTAMASEQSSLGPGLQRMTPATPSSGLVPNPPPLAPFVPPSRHEWDLVFQPVFDELFSPPASVASPAPI